MNRFSRGRFRHLRFDSVAITAILLMVVNLSILYNPVASVEYEHESIKKELISTVSYGHNGLENSSNPISASNGEVTLASGLGNWTRPFPSPGWRMKHEMVFDAKSEKVILFGGLLNYPYYPRIGNSETWAYDLGQNVWSNITTSPSPSTRYNHAMTYDSWNGKVVLFGGYASWGASNETWIFDGETGKWNNVTPPHSPSPRGWHRMAFDTKAGKVVLFGGGYGYYQYSNETWTYDTRSNIWANVTSSVNPGPRIGHSMTFDPVFGKVIMFGGENRSNNFKNDTWLFDTATSTWTEAKPSHAPTERSHAAMIYYASYRKVMLFGGERYKQDGGVWTYDPLNNNWTQFDPSNSPGQYQMHAMAYDASRGKAVMYGGSEYNHKDNTDAWSYDLGKNEWSDIYPPPGPSARSGTSMVSIEDGKMILFGGWKETWPKYYNLETWLFRVDSASWTNLTSLSSPQGRSGHAMTYDSKNRKIILFGGFNGTRITDETWQYDVVKNIWVNPYPRPSPPLSQGHAMAYDESSGKVVLFGGSGYGGTIYNRTWIYDVMSNLWMDVTPGYGPRAKTDHAMSYVGDGKILLYGGDPGPNETWIYDVVKNKWMETHPLTSPGPQSGHVMVYDSKNEHVILLGGSTPPYYPPSFGVTWLYKVKTNTWTNAKPESSPLWRDGPGMAYDPKTEKVVLFGGRYYPWYYDRDIWFYESIDPPSVVDTIPVDGALDVPLNSDIIVTFDKVMDPVSTATSFSIVPENSDCSTTVTGSVLRWSHVELFTSGTSYAVTIASTARSYAGFNMEKAYTFRFTTSTNTVPVPPKVISTLPMDGEVTVGIGVSIVVTFDQAMNSSATQNALAISPSLFGVSAVHRNVLVWSHGASFTSNTYYEITISTDAKSVAGENLLAPYTFNFTTGSIDIENPPIVTMVPEDGAIDVPINVKVVLSFTESMDIMAAMNAISIFPSSSWDYNWDPSQTVLTMTPKVDLQSNTQYTIEITTGAMSKVGIPLAFKFESSFKTGSFLSRTTLGIPSIIWIIIAIAITVVAIVIFIKRRRQKRSRKTISSTRQYARAEEIRIPPLYPQQSWPRDRKGGRSN